MKKSYFVLSATTVLIVILTIGGLACTSAPAPSASPSPTPTATPTPAPTPSPTPTPTPTPTPSPSPTPSSSAVTFQTMAASGQNTYSSTCAVCHGDNGQGTSICPVVMWGTGSTLGTYNGVTLFTDAQGMLNYMSKSMPLTAPGSLTSQQYNDLLAYILIQANKVSPSTVFNESQLGSITIK